MTDLLGVVAGKTNREICRPAIVMPQLVSAFLVALRAKLEDDLVQRPLAHFQPPKERVNSLLSGQS